MFTLDGFEWIYTVSLSLQLSGAVLLLLKYTFTNIGKGIRETSEKENRVEGGTLFLGRTQPTEEEYRENAWLNRIAFAFIALGYLTSIWGNIGEIPRYIIFVWVLIQSVLLTAMSYYYATKQLRGKMID